MQQRAIFDEFMMVLPLKILLLFLHHLFPPARIRFRCRFSIRALVILHGCLLLYLGRYRLVVLLPKRAAKAAAQGFSALWFVVLGPFVLFFPFVAPLADSRRGFRKLLLFLASLALGPVLFFFDLVEPRRFDRFLPLQFLEEDDDFSFFFRVQDHVLVDLVVAVVVFLRLVDHQLAPGSTLYPVDHADPVGLGIEVDQEFWFLAALAFFRWRLFFFFFRASVAGSTGLGTGGPHGVLPGRCRCLALPVAVVVAPRQGFFSPFDSLCFLFLLGRFGLFLFLFLLFLAVLRPAVFARTLAVSVASVATAAVSSTTIAEGPFPGGFIILFFGYRQGRILGLWAFLALVGNVHALFHHGEESQIFHNFQKGLHGVGIIPNDFLEIVVDDGHAATVAAGFVVVVAHEPGCDLFQGVLGFLHSIVPVKAVLEEDRRQLELVEAELFFVGVRLGHEFVDLGFARRDFFG
mmetsp:Transcript_6648/g.15914  ORF Transcript_6648/g.15914 Transcript_6648/m.15914 type:complete len:462 (-) Transcript_6648:376-1761(-)